MATFKVVLTFDDLPSDNNHKELIINEINNKIDSIEYFTKNIFYNHKTGIIFENNKIKFKFYSDDSWTEKMTLQRLKKWAEKNIKKSLLGRNKYYLDTYKIIKYRVHVKRNKKLLNLLKSYKKGWDKGGDERKKALNKYLNEKNKIQFGGSYKNYNNKKTKIKSKMRSNKRYKRCKRTRKR